jgi:hypothetical protein
MIQARKACGCVTAACLVDPTIDHKKFAKDYAKDGYAIEYVGREDATFFRPCPHKMTSDAVAILDARYARNIPACIVREAEEFLSQGKDK